MWKLPDGKVLSNPRQVKIGDTNYPARIFSLWSTEELANIGIKQYSEQKFDRRYFRAVSYGVDETATTYRKTCVVEPKFTRATLLQNLNVIVKATLISLYMRKKSELEAWVELDTSEALSTQAKLDYYRTELRGAYQEIKAAYSALTDYQDIIDYQWQSLLPVEPDV